MRETGFDIAGVILAGGLGTRLGNVKKALLDIGGRTILDRLLEVYRPIFPEILIAARDEANFAAYGLPVARDRFAARSSLTGIHAGLDAMRASHGFFAACDAPFLQPGLVELLLAEAAPEDDVVIPLKEDGYREPLCAIYSKRCLEFITPQLEREDFKIIRFFEHVRVKEVPVSRLRGGDPDLLSFFNVNRPEDLARAREMAESF
ncbi:NTP transferase domain-containing protein [Pseudodesulfovibrio cashew]|uniref:Probable molybdenum cofactor guanylyltransferase n=1 Tax=Pseudodesulfovibrio cashew TaxID=2678688 RepID=A0A6I6JCN7_9BACT|nr:molybdenum cofactor guanylyltransferase [Pseudodesulfovibrio cashew]QGY39841.1 NTP transferase domain-containing protein [Pseudodesulfovibrio cashew]